MESLSSSLDVLRQFRRDFDHLSNTSERMSALEKLQSWLSDLSVTQPPRDSQLSREFWRLRGVLWTVFEQTAKGDVTVIPLLLCVWDLQRLCDECRLFSDAFEGISAQYIVIKSLIENASFDAATPRSRWLYLRLMQAFKGESLNLEILKPEVIGVPVGSASQRSIKIALAVMLTVVTCGSQADINGMDIEWFQFSCCALRSLEALTASISMCETHQHHMKGAVYHAERILSTIPRRLDAKVLLQNLDTVMLFIQSFTRLSQRVQRSPSVTIVATIAELPSGCHVDICLECLRCLLTDWHTQSEAMRVMNGCIWRWLKIGDHHKDVRMLIKKLMTSRLDMTEPLPSWIVLHLLTCLVMCIQGGLTVCLTKKEILLVDGMMEAYQSKTWLKDEWTPMLEAMGQLTYALKTDSQSLSRWSDHADIAKWIATGLLSFSTSVMTANDDHLMDSLPSEKRRLVLSQAAMAIVKRPSIDPTSLDEDDHIHLLVTVTAALVEALPMPLPEMGYRGIPHDLRAVLDCAWNCAVALQTEHQLEASLHGYRVVCMLSAWCYDHWQRLGIKLKCLLSKSVSIGHIVSKMILAHEQLFKPGMLFIQWLVGKLVTDTSIPLVDDLKKFIQIHCRVLLDEMKANRAYSTTDFLSNAVMGQTPQLMKHPEIVLQLIRFEIVGWMKYTVGMNEIPIALRCLRPQCFNISTHLQQKGHDVLNVWLDALLMIFAVYTNAVQAPQALTQLKEMSHTLQRLPDQSFKTEACCLCRCLMFLIEAINTPSPSSRENEMNHQNCSDTIPLADVRDIVFVIDSWNSILATDAAVLDPELSLTLLYQCLVLSHARCWTAMEAPLLQAMHAICSKHNNIITEGTKALCHISLPIPYDRNFDKKTVIMMEAELMSMHDQSSKSFQRRVSLQLHRGQWHLNHGCMIEARTILSDARRYALGLFKSFASEGTSSCLIETKNVISGDAWSAHGLYATCLMMMAQVAIEFEEPNEGRYIMIEAMKVIKGLKSRTLICTAELLIAQLELTAHDLERAEASFRTAERILLGQAEQDSTHELTHDHALRLRNQFLVVQNQLALGRSLIKTASEMETWLSMSSDHVLHWSLRCECLRMQCHTAAAEGTLHALQAIGLMTDYLCIIAPIEVPDIDLYRFLLSACQWKDSGALNIRAQLHLFGQRTLTEEFRVSLDLGTRCSPLMSRIRSKLTSLQSVNPETQQIAQILKFVVQDMNATGVKEMRILLLLIAWNHCSAVTSIFQELSAVLGYLLAHSNHLHAAVYFLMVSLSNGLRLQTLYHLEKKVNEIEDVQALKECLTIQPLPIQLDPQYLFNLDEECQARLDMFLAEGANNGCLLSIQLPPKSNLVFQMIKQRLILVRYSRDGAPIVAVLPDYFPSVNEADAPSRTLNDVLGLLSVLLKENRDSFERNRADGEDKTVVEKWWNDRRKLDGRLKALVQSVEDGLGPWALLLDGRRLSDFSRSETQIFMRHHRPSHSTEGGAMTSTVVSHLLAILHEGRRSLSIQNIQEAAEVIEDVTGGSLTKQQCVLFLSYPIGVSEGKEATPVRAMTTARKSGRIGRMRSSSKIQTTEDMLPYLSPLPLHPSPCNDLVTPMKVTRDIQYRTEKARMMHGTDAVDPEQSSTLMILEFDVQQFSWESLPCLHGRSIYRQPNLHMALYTSKLQQRMAHPGKKQRFLTVSLTEGPDIGTGLCCLNLQSAFYVLDPEGDLVDSRTTFQEWFRSLSWKQLIPDQDAPISDTSKDLMDCLMSKDMFLYFGHNCAETLLQPKELRNHVIRSAALLMGCSSGKLKSPGEGSILEYVASGSCCCVGNLWAVSDAEINRFSKALIETWMVNHESVDVGLTVSRSRSASRLNYLIGAAPVVYGIPTRIRYSRE